MPNSNWPNKALQWDVSAFGRAAPELRRWT